MRGVICKTYMFLQTTLLICKPCYAISPCEIINENGLIVWYITRKKPNNELVYIFLTTYQSLLYFLISTG